VITNASSDPNYAVVQEHTGFSNQQVNFVVADVTLFQYNSTSGVAQVISVPIGPSNIESSEARSGGLIKSELDKEFSHALSIFQNNRDHILLYNVTGSARFYKIHHGEKIFHHGLKTDDWPKNLKRLRPFFLAKTKTDGLILVTSENEKQYAEFTPDLKAKGIQVKYVAKGGDWTGHLVIQIPRSEYAYEVEYNAEKGVLHISYFTLYPKFEGGNILKLDPVGTGYDHLLAYSFDSDGIEYWRVLFVRKSDGNVFVVTLQPDPDDATLFKHFSMFTYAWEAGTGWDFYEAFSRRGDPKQYLLTFNAQAIHEIFVVDNKKDSIEIKSSNNLAAKTILDVWTHYDVIPYFTR